LVFHSSTVTMMHGPINIRLTEFTLTLMYKLQESVADKDYIRCTICRDIGLSKPDIWY